MGDLLAMDKANQGNLLWPPIADAVDTFLKRRACGADSYERIWRLIHVWEAISITLVGAGVSRLREMDGQATMFRRCREHLYGRAWDSVTRSFAYSQGALDGSAMARLSILLELSSLDATNSSFLSALKSFLASEQLSATNLVLLWARICDVPDSADEPHALTVRDAMGLINEFRNRVAHVPFPYDVLYELANALEELTEQLFSIVPQPSQVFPDERRESPMCGSILWRDRVLYGSAHRKNPDSIEGLWFSYPPGRKKTDKREMWEAEPFAFVDSMLRPHVFTRLRAKASGTWELTRYRAEANAVINYEAPEWQANIPLPAESEYATPEAEKEQQEEEIVASVSASDAAGTHTLQQPATEFEQALRFIRNEEYEPAIQYFARLVATRPEYHIGWLRLGHAQRELAMRQRTLHRQQATQLFDDSIKSLTFAAEHAHLARRAQALYERSKAYYHRGRLTASPGDYTNALSDARKAKSTQLDSAYDTWLAYVQNHPPADEERYRMSVALSKSGKYAEAEAAAQEAIRLNHTHIGAWRSLATNLSQLGEHEQARSAWRTHDELLVKGPIDYDSAIYSALIDVRTNWSSELAWERLAKSYDREGRGEEAISEAEQILQIHPEAHASFLPLVNLLVNQLPNAVRELVAKMRAIDPANVHYIHLLGVATRKAKLNLEAVEDLRLACSLEPRNPTYWYALGRCLEDMGKAAAACDAFERAVDAKSPPHRKAQEHLAELRASALCGDGSDASSESPSPKVTSAVT